MDIPWVPPLRLLARAIGIPRHRRVEPLDRSEADYSGGGWMAEATIRASSAGGRWSATELRVALVGQSWEDVLFYVTELAHESRFLVPAVWEELHKATELLRRHLESGDEAPFPVYRRRVPRDAAPSPAEAANPWAHSPTDDELTLEWIRDERRATASVRSVSNLTADTRRMVTLKASCAGEDELPMLALDLLDESQCTIMVSSAELHEALASRGALRGEQFVTRPRDIPWREAEIQIGGRKLRIAVYEEAPRTVPPAQ
jgi:hypothetical protein